MKFHAALGRQDIASLYIARDETLWTVHQAFDTGLAPGNASPFPPAETEALEDGLGSSCTVQNPI